MQLNSYGKIYIFIFVIFLVGYIIVQALTSNKEQKLQSKNVFAWVMSGMFFGVTGNIAMLQFPLNNYPRISTLVNPNIYVLFFFALPAIGGLLGIVLYSILYHKNK